MTQTTDRPQHDHDEVHEVDLAITGMTITENGEPGKGARFEIHVPADGYRFA